MKVWNEIHCRLRKNSGFTLTELLLTTMILLMVSAVVAGGVPSAANAYFKIVDASNAQILLSTTVTSLRNELSFATDIKLKDNSTELDEYTNVRVKALSNDREQGITLTEKQLADEMIRPAQPLVAGGLSGALRSQKLVSGFQTISYNEATDVFTVSGLQVTKNGNPIAGPIDLDIRRIQP